MASNKDANNSKKRTYDIHNNSKMCNEEGRNRFHILLSTTYDLNNSQRDVGESKKTRKRLIDNHS